MKEIKPLARPPLLHVSVQESLKSYIDDNALAPGAPLPPENDLAQQLGVSRNSVREAIKALESLGILETRRGIGVFVKAFSFEPLLANLAYGLGGALREVRPSPSSRCWPTWPMAWAARCARSRRCWRSAACSRSG